MGNYMHYLKGKAGNEIVKISGSIHVKDVPLLYTKSLSEWNERGKLGFTPLTQCRARPSLACSLPVCPMVNAVYPIKQSVVVYSERQYGGRPYRLTKHANLLKDSEFGGVVRGTAEFVCFTFVKNKILTGIIVNEDTADSIGVFKFPLVEPTVCQLWHFSLSRNQQYVGLLVHMKPNILDMNHLAPEEFDIHIFEAYDKKDSLWLYQHITCIENLKTALDGGLRSVMVPQNNGSSHSCLLMPCWSQQDQHHAHLYDVCIHHLMLSLDEALALLCMEQKVEMTGQKLSKVLVMNAQNLQVLGLITTRSEKELWWINTDPPGCYINVVPSLHSNGYQIAQLNTVADDIGIDKSTAVLFVNVYDFLMLGLI